jgi:hypothetical protein
MLQVEDLVEPIACEALIKRVRSEELWKQLHPVQDITLLRIKQMIKSYIRVEEALVAHRSSSQIHREGVTIEPPNRNRSPIKRQDVKKKWPSREHPTRFKRVYIPVNTSYTEIYIALRG